MAILIRDAHLEEQVEKERIVRGYKTKSKALRDLVLERLTQIRGSDTKAPLKSGKRASVAA